MQRNDLQFRRIPRQARGMSNESHRLTRRSMLATIGTATLLPVILKPAKVFATTAEVTPTTTLPLWPGPPPGDGGPSGPVVENARGAISNIAVPSMEVFIPKTPNGIAMLVAGGGGYRRMSMRNEAHPAARWLNDRASPPSCCPTGYPAKAGAAGRSHPCRMRSAPSD
jgi:hypothetical protein